MFAALNAVPPWMHHLAGHGDGAADINPAADLPDGEHVTRLQ